MKKLLVLAFAIVFACGAKAQFAVYDVDRLGALKNSTLFVVMKSTKGDGASKYIQVWKEYWKFSPQVEFIEYDDLKKHQQPNTFFASITSQSKTLRDYSRPGSARVLKEIVSTFLGIWTYKDPKHRKAEDSIDVIGRIELYHNKDGNNQIKNFSPGLLKNQLQFLQMLFSKDQTQELSYPERGKKELAALKNDTLYILDYTIVQLDNQSGRQKEPCSIEEIAKRYPYKFRIINKDELSNKILSSEKPLYYLVCARNSHVDRYMYIANSKTGELLYSAYYSFGYDNIKPEELGIIARAVKAQ